MAKVTRTENWRVTITPDDKYCRFWKDRDYREACEEILSAAKRHVDGIGSIEVQSDTVEVCEFCGSNWETDADTGEPVCCGKAVKEFESAQIEQGPAI